MNRDFKCNKTLLLSQMKYFEQYLVDAHSLDDIDISVHCDIKIFEWLMKYLKDNCEPKLGKSMRGSLTFDRSQERDLNPY